MATLTQQLEQLRRKNQELEQWIGHLNKQAKEVEQDIDRALTGAHPGCGPLASAYTRIAHMATEHRALVDRHGKPCTSGWMEGCDAR